MQSKYQPAIDFIQREFDGGKRLVEIKTNNPLKFRKNLYAIVHRRGLDWRFATLEHSVFVSIPVTFSQGCHTRFR